MVQLSTLFRAVVRSVYTTPALFHCLACSMTVLQKPEEILHTCLRVTMLSEQSWSPCCRRALKSPSLEKLLKAVFVQMPVNVQRCPCIIIFSI